jgi:hypothetical protein
MGWGFKRTCAHHRHPAHCQTTPRQKKILAEIPRPLIGKAWKKALASDKPDK